MCNTSNGYNCPTNMARKIAEKFINNSATPEETKRVLGMAINVKSISNLNDVQVAVVEGRVSFTSTESILEEHSVVLQKAQYV